MGSTPLLGLPYPDGGELANSSAIQQLALAVESEFDGQPSFDEPDYITLSPIFQWDAVSDNANGPLRLYRAGRFVQMMGEVINKSGTHGNQVTEAHKTFARIPDGWRPVTRIRQTTVRSTRVEVAELYVEVNGDLRIPDAKYFSDTPGYSVCATWVTP